MALVGIEGYAIPHGSKNGEGGGTTIIYNNTGGNVPSDLNVTTINASKGDIKLLTGTSMSYDDASIDYLSGEEASLNKISGQDLNYNNGKIGNLSSTGINTNTFDTQEMNAIKAWVQSLISERITTDYLTVTKQAHFFELIVDKVKSVGGTLLITAANCIADYVKALKTVSGSLVETTLDDANAEYYDVYWLATGTDGRENNNDWEVNDQAYCQSFNVKTGTSYDTTNKYYWRLVTAKLQDTIMNLSNGETIEQTPMGDPDYNSLYIYLPRLYWDANNYTDDSWEVNVTDDGRVYWEQVALQSNKFCGIMGTTDTVNGIVLTPAANSDLVNTIPTKLSFYCYKPNTQHRPPTRTPARLNVTVTYINGAIEVFTAPETPASQYDLTLSVGLPIDNIVITNADEVSWKTVHGIRLSNVSGQYDETVMTGTASIPSTGDNICQLGYRWRYTDHNEDESMKSRGNAIIIAAHESPDLGCQSSAIGEELAQIKPPSYAQYEAIGSVNGHRFDLAYYRKTYMDGNGSKFYGDFYIRAEGPQGQQGYENMSTDVAELKVDVQGIQGAVYGTQGTQGLVEQVSYLNQQSDSISLAVQKVYGSVGIKNEFGFNTGTKSYDNADYRTCLMWPYGYGIIGWGRLNRVCQLNIRESVDETWTISCYMKANAATRINVNFCDINAVRIYKNGEQIELPSGNWVSVGTSYDKWEFIFEHINDVNHGGSTTIGGSWGGFFDFEQYPDSLNTIHVKNIVLTRGEKPNCEFAMAEEDLTYAGSGQDFTWNKGTVTLEAGTFRGYPVYRNTSYPSTGNYLDVFTYDTYTIKDHMPYTLSFWAKASVMNTYIESFMYNNDIHSIPSGVVADDNFGIDGRWKTYLSTDWQYYTVKWVPDLKTTQWPTDYVKNIIACRISYSSNSQHSGYVYLAGVTLQEGWVEGMGGTTSSLIKQTADEISLSVTNGLQSTGIDITNGKIYLQGNKVEFADSTGGHQGNIWIDPTYGTLHAVNGDFSGNVTATSGSITGQMNVASGGSIIVGEEGSYRIKIAQSSNRGYITMLDGNSNNIILMNYDADKGAGQIKFSEANAPRERYTFINPNSMESVYHYKNDNNQWAEDYSHITTQVGRRMAETEYDDLYVTGGLGARKHIKIGIGTTGSGSSDSVINLRAYDDNQDSAWPVCHLDTKGANWMDKGHVHVMTMAELKTLLENSGNYYYYHLRNYAVMLTRINDYY